MKHKKVQATSEIGNIIMSIDNLYNKVETKIDKKNENLDHKLKTFDIMAAIGKFSKSLFLITVTSIDQLDKIKNNIEDKQKLIAKLEQKKLETTTT